MKATRVIALSSLLVACATQQLNAESSIKNNIGWVHSSCLAIHNPNLSTGDKVALHLFDAGEGSVIEVSIGHQITSSSDCYALLDDRADVNKSAGYSFYALNGNGANGLAIGVLSSLEKSNFKFDYCNTSEGIQFTVSNNDEVVWQGYYYIGHDTESTCEDD